MSPQSCVGAAPQSAPSQVPVALANSSEPKKPLRQCACASKVEKTEEIYTGNVDTDSQPDLRDVETSCNP